MEISPPSAAVRFGDPLWANCTALTEQIRGMGWESSQGGQPVTSGVRWLSLNISSVTHWGLSPICYIVLLPGGQCTKPLPVTVYSKFSSCFFILSHLLLMIMTLFKHCGVSCSLFLLHRSARRGVNVRSRRPLCTGPGI